MTVKSRSTMKIAHLTTVDLSLRYLILPQLVAATEWGDSYGISAPGPHVGFVEERGVTHVPLKSSTRGFDVAADLRSMVELWRILRDIKPDVLHTHNPKPGVYGRILGRLAGVPIVVNTVHGLYATADSVWSKRVIVYALEALASRFSDAELVQNPEDVDLLASRRIVKPEKLRLLGNGVDLSRFNPERRNDLRESARLRWEIPSDSVVVCFVGRLVEEKGLPELVEAMSSISGNVTTLIAGPVDPDKQDAVTQSVIDRGETTGIRFLGMVEDIEALYAASDIFVLPSHREGFPRAAMEAAAMGLPVIATNIRGCRQVVDEGVNGLLVPVNRPEALRNALTRLVNDADLRSDMGRASAAKAQLEFDENEVVRIVMETYIRLADEKGLSWSIPGDPGDVHVREARPEDAPAIAELHEAMIGSGFLSSLGSRFLNHLYAALIEFDSEAVYVAEGDGGVVGFIAGTTDTGGFYRSFIIRRGFRAGFAVIPSLLKPRTWKSLWETFRYGSTHPARAHSELLSMAVAPKARGGGVGRRLVENLLQEARERDIEAMSVVVGASNSAAIGLYESCGFGSPRVIEIHSGSESLELLWTS